VTRDGAVAGLLLAAGGGRRFGGAKALAELDGRLLVERGMDLLRGGGCSPLVVVLGAQADDVTAVADLDGAQVVINPHWQEGMGSSLRIGFDTLIPGPAAAVVIALVDQPLLGPAAVRRVRQAWAAGAAAAVATYEDRPGHPVLLDRALWSQARAQAGGDVGARTLLRGHPELVTQVACDDTGDPFDVDTQAAMEQARAALARR
jgi:nicotine blue oxidoreductase